MVLTNKGTQSILWQIHNMMHLILCCRRYIGSVREVTDAHVEKNPATNAHRIECAMLQFEYFAHDCV